MLIFVDVEALMGVGAPSVGDMTEFGAVAYPSMQPFYGKDASKTTFQQFADWLMAVSPNEPPVFVSDNPAYDWQWINFYFWKYFRKNPFGHSARRIGDFYAGVCLDFRKSQEWKKFRSTKYDHHPVHDALGNAEAFKRIMEIVKVKHDTTLSTV